MCQMWCFLLYQQEEHQTNQKKRQNICVKQIKMVLLCVLKDKKYEEENNETFLCNDN